MKDKDGMMKMMNKEVPKLICSHAVQEERSTTRTGLGTRGGGAGFKGTGEKDPTL